MNTKEYNKKYYLQNKEKFQDKSVKWRNSLSEQFRCTLSSYNAMKHRCYDKNQIGYSNYGGRGIIICERWKQSFKNFLIDMGLKPAKGWCIDRIDNDKNYEPTNCRWVSLQDSLKNKRHK